MPCVISPRLQPHLRDENSNQDTFLSTHHEMSQLTRREKYLDKTKQKTFFIVPGNTRKYFPI